MGWSTRRGSRRGRRYAMYVSVDGRVVGIARVADHTPARVTGSGREARRCVSRFGCSRATMPAPTRRSQRKSASARTGRSTAGRSRRREELQRSRAGCRDGRRRQSTRRDRLATADLGIAIGNGHRCGYRRLGHNPIGGDLRTITTAIALRGRRWGSSSRVLFWAFAYYTSCSSRSRWARSTVLACSA